MFRDRAVSAPQNEFAYIDWIRSQVGQHPRVALGIGDDAAVLQLSAGGHSLIAVDMLMEGVHFTFPPATPHLAGRKALAVNLSDIAAMAGTPVAAVVSAAYPQGRIEGIARQVHEGIEELAAEFNVAIAGGDTNSWDGPLVVNVTVLGDVSGRGAVRRDGAQPGDWILTTGQFGGSRSGRHLTFPPRVHEALRLHEAADLTAMIDVSDGLVADLSHILEESHVGAELLAESIPVSAAAKVLDDGTTPLEHALSDGEDFELCFTVAEEAARKLLAEPPVEVPLTRIGTITNSQTLELLDAAGNRRQLTRSGWTHEL